VLAVTDPDAFSQLRWDLAVVVSAEALLHTDRPVRAGPRAGNHQREERREDPHHGSGRRVIC
jgi:hypothetical protein